MRYLTLPVKIIVSRGGRVSFGGGEWSGFIQWADHSVCCLRGLAGDPRAGSIFRKLTVVSKVHAPPIEQNVPLAVCDLSVWFLCQGNRCT